MTDVTRIGGTRSYCQFGEKHETILLFVSHQKPTYMQKKNINQTFIVRRDHKKTFVIEPGGPCASSRAPIIKTELETDKNFATNIAR